MNDVREAIDMSESNPAEIPESAASATGAAWSAILAAAAGCAAIGILTLLTETWARASQLLTFNKSVGDLSGVTTLSILIWLFVWVLVHARWKNRAITASGRILAASLILILIGLLGTFPPIADWLAGL
jgi:fluoride ion exporter CrcB/FEX